VTDLRETDLFKLLEAAIEGPVTIGPLPNVERAFGDRIDTGLYADGLGWVNGHWFTCGFVQGFRYELTDLGRAILEALRDADRLDVLRDLLATNAGVYLLREEDQEVGEDVVIGLNVEAICYGKHAAGTDLNAAIDDAARKAKKETSHDLPA